jgi:hypothetical protein
MEAQSEISGAKKPGPRTDMWELMKGLVAANPPRQPVPGGGPNAVVKSRFQVAGRAGSTYTMRFFMNGDFALEGSKVKLVTAAPWGLIYEEPTCFSIVTERVQGIVIFISH